MSCKCIFNSPPESIEGTVSKQGTLYTRLSRNLIFLYVVHYHVTRIKSEIIKAQKARKTIGKLNWAILSSFLSSSFFLGGGGFFFK